uniref:Uncharacterized protein n=1 Tax=Panagrolaimus sp. PS1159 TaxID=55785 RepID=A0AC35G1C4_9BILA
MMEESIMKKYLDIIFDTNANEYISQLSHQQMKGFIKKLMNVLTQKNNKYRTTVGFILGGWVRRLRPKYFEIYHVDIFREIPIAKNLRKIRNSSIHFKNVFIALGNL